MFLLLLLSFCLSYRCCGLLRPADFSGIWQPFEWYHPRKLLPPLAVASTIWRWRWEGGWCRHFVVSACFVFGKCCRLLPLAEFAMIILHFGWMHSKSFAATSAYIYKYSSNVMVSDATIAKGVVGSFLSVDGREIVSLTSGDDITPSSSGRGPRWNTTINQSINQK